MGEHPSEMHTMQLPVLPRSVLFDRCAVEPCNSYDTIEPYQAVSTRLAIRHFHTCAGWNSCMSGWYLQAVHHSSSSAVPDCSTRTAAAVALLGQSECKEEAVLQSIRCTLHNITITTSHVPSHASGNAVQWQISSYLPERQVLRLLRLEHHTVPC
jgi:hypothetical protein